MTQTTNSAPHHKWERVPTYIAAAQSTDGNERQERSCMTCGLTKITVIPPRQPPYPWRRWRWPGGLEFEMDRTPACTGNAAEPVQLREAS